MKMFDEFLNQEKLYHTFRHLSHCIYVHIYIYIKNIYIYIYIYIYFLINSIVFIYSIVH